MSLYGCYLLLSTAFHPQTDGMSQVTNRTLKQLLLYCMEEKDWEKKLPYLEMVYNSSSQLTTKESSHYMMTGR